MRFGGTDVTWRQRRDLEAVAVRLGIEGSCAMQDFFCNGEARDGGKRAGVQWTLANN
jgi:hypothetical protein